MNNDLMMAERNEIITMQKAIVSRIFDYQMKYGSNSVSWSVGVSFVDKPQIKKE